MTTPAISPLTTNLSISSKSETHSSQDSENNSTGWKYVTIKEGNIIYTYIVIGKNMKVLIGQSNAPEGDKDKNNTGNKKDGDTGDNADKVNASQQTSSKLANEKASLLTDCRMLGLTGYYQKKLRESMENMENRVLGDNDSKITRIEKTEHC